MRILLPVAFIIAAILFMQTVHGAELRHALVVGNSAYKDGRLKNPRNDAKDIASTLRKLGFDVTLRLDANKRQMEKAIRGLGEKLQSGGVGFFYYAGHAIQDNSARNFLIPIGARIQSEADVAYEAVDIALVLDHFEKAKNRVNILIMDACRNNPFRSFMRSATRGLAPIQAVTGTFVAYATQPGNVAADGTGRNGLFTKHLLQSLSKSDSELQRVFLRVTAGVSKESKNRQVPWVSHSMTGEFYFNDVVSTADTTPSQTPLQDAPPKREEQPATSATAPSQQLLLDVPPKRADQPTTAVTAPIQQILKDAANFASAATAPVQKLLRDATPNSAEKLDWLNKCESQMKEMEIGRRNRAAYLDRCLDAHDPNFSRTVAFCLLDIHDRKSNPPNDKRKYLEDCATNSSAASVPGDYWFVYCELKGKYAGPNIGVITSARNACFEQMPMVVQRAVDECKADFENRGVRPTGSEKLGLFRTCMRGKVPNV